MSKNQDYITNTHKLDRHEIYSAGAWYGYNNMLTTLDNECYTNMTYILVLIVRECGSDAHDHVTRCVT